MSRSLTVFVALAALALASCGDDASDAARTPTPSPPSPPASSSPPGSPSPTATPTTPAAVAVPEQLEFTAPTLDGGTFDGASLAGRAAVLWFWAPWCPVCRREAPLIADLAEQHGDRVAFLGVAGLSGDLEAMRGFVTDTGLDAITHLDDRDGDVYTRFEVTQQYDLGLVAPDGTVEILRGPLDEDEIVAAVERLAAG